MTDTMGFDTVLGEEFLTWLWFKSEVYNGLFRTKNGDVAYNVSIEQKITVEGGGDGDYKEQASVSGFLLKEAKLGLLTGKKVTRAQIKVEKDGLDWHLALKAEDFNINSLKTPKIEKEKSDDTDANFLEKMYLIEACLELLDDVYKKFITLRLDEKLWEKEVIDINSWIKAAE